MSLSEISQLTVATITGVCINIVSHHYIRCQVVFLFFLKFSLNNSNFTSHFTSAPVFEIFAPFLLTILTIFPTEVLLFAIQMCISFPKPHSFRHLFQPAPYLALYLIPKTSPKKICRRERKGNGTPTKNYQNRGGCNLLFTSLFAPVYVE